MEEEQKGFYKMVDQKYDESTRYLENYVDGYDEYDGGDTMVTTNG